VRTSWRCTFNVADTLPVEIVARGEPEPRLEDGDVVQVDGEPGFRRRRRQGDAVLALAAAGERDAKAIVADRAVAQAQLGVDAGSGEHLADSRGERADRHAGKERLDERLHLDRSAAAEPRREAALRPVAGAATVVAASR
jgi:hypothetical protein